MVHLVKYYTCKFLTELTSVFFSTSDSGHQAESPSAECSTFGEADRSTGDINTNDPVDKAGIVVREGEDMLEDMQEEGQEEGRDGAEYNPEGQEVDLGNIRVFPGRPFLDPGRIPNLAANPVHEQLLGRQVDHVWGQGVKLGEVVHNPHAIDPVPKATSAGDSAMKRLERKLQQHQEAGMW